MNAPEAGTIKEFLAQEEDTVVVGQDLVRLEVGGEGKPKEPKATQSNEPAAAEPSKSAPAPRDEPSQPKEDKSTSSLPREQPKETPPTKKVESKANESKSGPAQTVGNREERRVSSFGSYWLYCGC